MVGEVIALGCRDGCRQEGGWSNGRRRCRLQSFPPPESRGVVVTARGDEIVSFGSLIDVMKSQLWKYARSIWHLGQKCTSAQSFTKSIKHSP